MLKEVLKSIMLSQQEWLVEDEREIPREILNDFSNLPPFVYILTGVRRSGKSTLLKQVMKAYGSKNYFNFEDSRCVEFSLKDFNTLEELFLEEYGNRSILFFDEIQNVPEWERYVRNAMDRKITVIITGSNAKLLSKELGDKLTGRHLDFEVFPFSYNEFLNYFKISRSAESFRSYLLKGGFPSFLNTGIGELHSTLVSDILTRDIFTRYNLRNYDAYRKLLSFLLSNTSKEISFNNLTNIFEFGSPNSVMDFMTYLDDAYLVFLVSKFDYSLKVQARNPKKNYSIDTGLVNFYSFSSSPDYGRLLENLVFLQLKRKKKQIWYFKGKRECDFVIKDNSDSYSTIQVSWKIDDQNEKREITGLTEAMDLFGLSEGLIITFDQEDTIRKDSKTINLLPAWKWEF